MKQIKDFEKLYKERFNYRFGLRKIGLENENPTVKYIEDSYTEFNVRKMLLKELVLQGWVPKYEGNLLVAVENNGVVVGTDAGKGCIEIAYKPGNSLWEVFSDYYNIFPEIYNTCKDLGGLILGYGIQPVVCESKWVEKERYKVLLEQLPSVRVISLTASSQIHIEISREELILALNTFNALTFSIIALFGNSPIWQGKIGDALVTRETLYDVFGRGRSGIMSQKFERLEEYFNYVFDLKFLLTKEDGKFVKPEPEIFLDYVKDKEPEEIFNHYLWHEGTVWWNSRLRFPYGTIEIRPACSQNHTELPILAAFCLGIAENLEQVSNFIFNETGIVWEEWNILKERAIKFGLKAEFDGCHIAGLIEKILLFAEEGLEKRKLGEEYFLIPLSDRIKNLENPANRALKLFKERGLKGLIDYTCRLSGNGIK